MTGPAARRSIMVAASSGLALSMAASSAIAAPEAEAEYSALPQVDVSTLSNQARAVLNVSPTVSVPADVSLAAIADVEVAATPPKTSFAEDETPLDATIARRAAEARAAEQAALAEQRAAEASAARTGQREASTNSNSTASAAAPTAAAEAPAPAASGNAIVDIAFRYVGTPYVYGGASPAGFDCSGFTWYVYQQAGISIPRSSGAQRNAGTVVSASQARPGDLVWWPGHVGIYLGNGQHIAARNPSKPLQAGPISHVGRGAPTYIRIG